jgi:protein TonB
MKAALFLITLATLLCAVPASAHAAASEKRITYQEAAKLAIRTPKPEYPLEARQKKMTGGGVLVVHVDAGGIVTSVTMRQSTGSPPLDRAAMAAFERWKFKPGQAFYFQQPVAFTMAGFHY